MIQFSDQVILAALAGLAAHWFYFNRGEHDLMAANIARAHLIFMLFLAYLKYQYEELSRQQIAKECFVVGATYALANYLSMACFRLLLSPLKHIPSPLSLRLTKLSHMWAMAQGRNCEFLEDLHYQYGNMVRTGM